MKLLALTLIAAAVFPSAQKPIVPTTPREKVIAMALTQVGVQEATGKNDGKQVEAYISSVGLDAKGGYPYCGAFVYWVGREALGNANPYPRSAWSPDMVKKGVRVTTTTEIKGGEAFGIYFPRKGRIAHTGLVERRDSASLITIEANTSANAAIGSDADRDGQGVYRKRRHWRTVHSVRDWLTE